MEVERSRADAALHSPKQERSRRTLNAIVRASLELLSEGGLEGTTVQEIVDRAGRSVGSFYARFAGKADLLRYLEHALWDDALVRWSEAVVGHRWDGLELDEVVEGVIRLLVTIERTSAAQRRVLGARRPGGAAEVAQAFTDAVHRDVSRLILAHRDRMAHPEPEVAVAVGLAAVRGAAVGSDGSSGTGAMPVLGEDRRVAELTQLLLSYLGVDEHGLRQASTQVEFFDIWG